MALNLQSPEQLQQLEAMVERMYKSQDQQERTQAENTLRIFSTSTEQIPQCKVILENSTNSYALLMATSSLLKLVTEQPVVAQLRLDIRNYLLQYLANKGPTLDYFVIVQMVQLLGRLTKLGWFELEQHREIVSETTKFLTAGTPNHFYIGLKIFNELISEINHPLPGRSLTQHRKTAVSFRDICLCEIFKIALESLGKLTQQGPSDDRVKEALVLANKCLAFDFVGTAMDESTEDLGTIQVPSSWRPVLEDESIISLFFDYYQSTRPPLSNQALECLVRLASVRRSIFLNEAERTQFLGRLLNGTLDILHRRTGLGQHENYHEYCRLLGRFKINYQLSELVNIDNYPEWIRLVAEFTITSLQNWQWASGSVYYLLSLWSRLVSSTPYLKGDTPSLLETYVPKIIDAYVTSRIQAVPDFQNGQIEEDPLEDDDQLQEQLESIPHLCRFQYETTSKYIISMMDPLLEKYVSMVNGALANGVSIQILEGQLTWFIYIVGAIIRGRLSSSSAEMQEVIDGELASRVFKLVQVTDEGFHGMASRFAEDSKQRLNISILSFFQNFRKVYIGEQAMHSSKVYKRLSESVRVSDHLGALSVMVNKIASNLKNFASSESVVEHTLNLFQELALGYMSGKLMMRLDGIVYLLSSHTRDHFPFLEQKHNMRNRTVFYLTLARLLFLEDNPSRFRSFMVPLQNCLRMLAAASTSDLRSEAARKEIMGIFRDLRGVITATNSRRTFGLTFDWMYPEHFPLILRICEIWYDTPEVTTPLLKFIAEFVLNKSQRLTFDSSSPNGILLFREVSKVLVAYGTRILALPSEKDIYRQKYKGIWICLSILQRSLSGNYVNFGVFNLYGDPALNDALNMALKMTLMMPLSDIVSYRKVGKAYFSLLETLCANHTAFIASLDQQVFEFLMSTVEAGLKSLDQSVPSQCAHAVDQLAAYHFNNSISPTKEGPPSEPAQKLASHLANRPNMFPEILKTIFEIVLFEETANQWSLSRPMLSLILINEQSYVELQSTLAASLTPDRRERLLQCFSKLMNDVSVSLDSRNRDKFTQNMTVFRHDFRKI